LHRLSSNWNFKSVTQICTDRAKQVAAATLTVSAAKSHNWDRQGRIHVDKVAFNATRKNPCAEDVAILG
jgi:hypothetical protein